MADEPTEHDVPTAENPVLEPIDDLLGAPSATATDVPDVVEPERAPVDDAPEPASAAVAPKPDAAEPENGATRPEPVENGGAGADAAAAEAEPDAAEPAPGDIETGAAAHDVAEAEPGAVEAGVEGDVPEPDAVVVDPDATSATLAPRRSSLSRPLPWLAVGAGLLLAALFTFAYVGAFADPIDELRDLKIAVVDLDQPVAVAGQSIDVGGDVVAATAADTTAAVAWTPFATREEAIAALDDNELAGAVILPADLSQRVAAIGTSLGAAPQASVEVLRNPGAGSLQPAVVDQAAAALIAQLNATVAQRLSTTLTGLNAQVAPANVTALATPVVVTYADVPDVGDHGGRGLPPLYVAVMTMLTGLVGAMAVHTAVGAVAGRERIEVMGREIHVQRLRVRPGSRYWQEAALVGILALGAAIVVPVVAVGIIGVHADRPFLTAPIVALGVLAAGWLTLLCVTAFGVFGEVLVVLLTTIFGVPSARGVYPAEALPGFFDFLGTFLPLRYLTDALRATFFFDGSDAAGLGTGVIVLWVWALGSLFLGGLVAGAISRREARERAALNPAGAA